MAYTVSNIMATEISNSISQVSFPVYAKIQDDLSRLKRGYLQTLKVTAIISFGITALVFVLIEDFTEVFLGVKWRGIISITRVLVLWGLSRSISATTGALFTAVGRPDVPLKLQLVRLLLIAILIYPLAARYEAVGVAAAVVFSSILVDPVAECLAFRQIRCRLQEMARLLLPPALAACGAVACALALGNGLSAEDTTLRFVTLLLSSVAVYIGFMFCFNRWFNLGLGTLIQEVMQNLSSETRLNR
jgi:O-antigen/teichoic acid export membrane protein